MIQRSDPSWGRFLACAAFLLTTFFSIYAADSLALPLFARQTGQNCMSCHAGGQFPELTPYGRMFKLTGYTIGDRTDVPISVMGVASVSKVNNTSKSASPADDFQKNGAPIFATGSVFVGGKLAEKIGAFIQVTYDNYAAQRTDNSQFQGHSNADNIDIRYADRWIDVNQDLIFGVSLNNNPSIADPWNTAPSWMQYVPVPSPTSSQFIDGAAPYPGYAAGGNIAGLTTYLYWNKLIYAELGGYQTSKGATSLMSAGVGSTETTKLKGTNPYWRIALTRDWGAHNVMIGASGMLADIYDDPSDTSNPATLSRYRDIGIDAQYQYILDPQTVTAQFAYMREKKRYSDSTANQAAAFFDALGNPLANTNATDTTNTLRAKVTYTYQAMYGGSLGFFNHTGSTNTANQTAGFDATMTFTPDSSVTGNLSGNPASRGWTCEAFWLPIQYVRVGAQYTMYNKFNGASSDYNGAGRDAKDNNSLFLYVWAAY